MIDGMKKLQVLVVISLCFPSFEVQFVVTTLALDIIFPFIAKMFCTLWR